MAIAPDILQAALRLEKAEEPFVLAIVVRAEKPTSAKAGAKAIIKADGEWIGWIGGSCSQPTVAYEAQQALASREPRVVRLSSRETCAGGGALDIYLEPHMPKPHLVVVGHHPVAEALVEMARPLGFRVSVMTPHGAREQFPAADVFKKSLDFSALGPESYVVVASHGNYDQEALEKASESESVYLALVSSQKRAQSLLAEARLDVKGRSRLKFPAGLDIGAETPEEIALSILAEIVSVRRKRAASRRDPEEPSVAQDPICGMSVRIDAAQHVLRMGEETFYFCGAGCKEKFVQVKT